MIISQTGTGESPEHEKPIDNQYDVYGYPIGRRTLSQRGGSSQPEPAIKDTVNAQIESLKLHFEDSIRLLKSELGGQIDMLRREISDLQVKKQEKQHKRWDIKVMLFSSLILLLTTGVGVVIGWFLNLHYK